MFREYRFVGGGATKEGNWRRGGFGSVAYGNESGKIF